MDADQLRTLEAWATGLALDERPEVRAAAKAILLLVDEVQSLRAALLTEMPPDVLAELVADDQLELAEETEAPDSHLRARLRALAARARPGRPTL
jgi:hypothetical protein